MDNYKILNSYTNKIIKLLNELGYGWVPTTNDSEASLLKAHWILAENSGDIAYSSTESFYEQDSYKELSFAQLKDLVVLKRNDINDANCIDKKREAWYLASDGTYYAWQYRKLCWDTESDACVEAHDIKPITQPQDPALISGAEALRALADGKEVEFQQNENWYSLIYSNVHVECVLNDSYKLRLKPQTIKVELELPKPFKPRDGDDCFIVDSEQEDGFYRFTYSENSGFHQNFIQFGVYRSEVEVKQVVEQLRKIRGTNS